MTKFVNIDDDRSTNHFYNSFDEKYEKKLFDLRRKINGMYFKDHFSKSIIAKKKKVSRPFVIKWTESLKQNFTEDNRGWKKGQRRKWAEKTETKIKKNYNDLKNNPAQFYLGATVIDLEWRKKYSAAPPPLRTIGQILQDLNISKKIKKDRHKGAAKYLCYPEHTIFNLIAERILELDFIGKKFIDGQTEPLSFIGFSFKKLPKLRYFKRILGETGDEIIEYSKLFFEKFEKPDAIKMDNGFAMAGSSSHPGVISHVPLWCLAQKIIPIYAVPRKPFSQASIEGNNSVFARNFWNKLTFDSIAGMDEKLKLFNKSSLWYSNYDRSKIRKKEDQEFIPQIYFIRKVYEDQENEKGEINILNEKINLPNEYINLYTLSQWNLKTEMLYVYFEKEQEKLLIKELRFEINENCKFKTSLSYQP